MGALGMKKTPQLAVTSRMQRFAMSKNVMRMFMVFAAASVFDGKFDLTVLMHLMILEREWL